MTALLFDHLWQSTLMLAAAGAIAFLLRHNNAAARHAVWLAASVKFLIPFALLAWLGSLLPLRPVPVLKVIGDLTPLAQPFSGPAPLAVMPATALPDLTPWLLALWVAGIGASLALWLTRGAELQQLARIARPMAMAGALPVRSSRQQLEPGLVGIAKPVILLPDGIMEHLNAAEIDAILAHELCHWRRRDNLTGALHMLVTALFWFWPPVWWLGGRLIEERERACDEAVVAQGADRRTYADGILKICKLYLHSPLAAMAGISSGALKLRVEAIMADRGTRQLGVAQTSLLAAGAMMALAAPIAAGMLDLHPVAALRMQAAADKLQAYLPEEFTAAPAPLDPLSPPAANARVRRAAAAFAARSAVIPPATPAMARQPEVAPVAAPDRAAETETSPASEFVQGSAIAGSVAAASPGGNARSAVPGAATMASSGTANSARGGNGYDLDPYLMRVAGQIQHHLLVPVSLQAFRRDRLGGTALVHLVFRPDGSVQVAEIAKSSGFRGFDEAALEAVRRADPLPPIPPEVRLAQINGVIPMAFTIN